MSYLVTHSKSSSSANLCLRVVFNSYFSSQSTQFVSLVYILSLSSYANDLSIALIFLQPLLLFAGFNHRIAFVNNSLRLGRKQVLVYSSILHLLALAVCLLFIGSSLAKYYLSYRVFQSFSDVLIGSTPRFDARLLSKAILSSLPSIASYVSLISWIFLAKAPHLAFVICFIAFLLFFLVYYLLIRCDLVATSSLLTDAARRLFSRDNRYLSLFLGYGLSAFIGSQFIYSTRYIYAFRPELSEGFFGPALNQYIFTIVSLPVLFVAFLSKQIGENLVRLTQNRKSSVHFLANIFLAGSLYSMLASIIFYFKYAAPSPGYLELGLFLFSAFASSIFWLLGTLFSFQAHSLSHHSSAAHKLLSAPFLFSWISSIVFTISAYLVAPYLAASAMSDVLLVSACLLFPFCAYLFLCTGILLEFV